MPVCSNDNISSGFFGLFLPIFICFNCFVCLVYWLIGCFLFGWLISWFVGCLYGAHCPTVAGQLLPMVERRLTSEEGRSEPKTYRSLSFFPPRFFFFREGRSLSFFHSDFFLRFFSQIFHSDFFWRDIGGGQIGA